MFGLTPFLSCRVPSTGYMAHCMWACWLAEACHPTRRSAASACPMRWTPACVAPAGLPARSGQPRHT